MSGAPLPVWIDDRLVAPEDAAVPLSDRGFTLGDGVFETLLWMPSGAAGTPGGIACFAAHMARLSHAATSLGLAADVNEGTIARRIHQLCSLSTDTSPGPLAVRLTLSRGSGPRGLAVPQPAAPRLILTAAPYQAPTTPLGQLVRTGIARAPGAPSARFKTLSYIDSVEALRQAQAAGGDDGILVGTAGEPLCASAASLIVVRNGAALTAPVISGALPGITRGSLVGAGLVREASLSWADVETAEAILLANALIGVRAVERFEGRTLSVGGAVEARLRSDLAKHRRASLPQFHAAVGAVG
jgi:branched-chain amino acid aminotransferase